MMTTSSRLLLGVLLARAAYAQPNRREHVDAVADSAAVAREAWSAATAAYRAGNLEAARDAAARAASAWPAQPAYLWGLATLAARTHDTAAVHDALTRYARLGLGRDLSETAFAEFRSLAWFRAVDSAHTSNRMPIRMGRVAAALADSTLWPEGVDVDRASGRTYVTSIRHGAIVVVERDGRQWPLWSGADAGVGAVFAVRVDSARGMLWATTSAVPQMAGFQPADSAIAFLLEISLATGRVVRRIAPPGSGPHVLGDVAVAANGDVFVSDSRVPLLYRLRRGGDTLEPMTHPLFRSLQGIAPEPSGRLYVADYSHGILRVDFETRRVTRVAPDHWITTIGCDGLAFHAGSRSLIAIQNGMHPPQVMRFRLDGSGDRITAREVLDRQWDVADEPTSGTLVGDDFVYVANSQWEKYDGNGRRVPRTSLRAPVLITVPLR